jgi:hypothetical protein
MHAKNKDFVSVYFPFQNNRRCYHGSYKLSITDKFGIARNTKNLECKLGYSFVRGNVWGWSHFICRYDLFDKDNGLIKDGTLTLSGSFDFVSDSKFGLEKLISKESGRISDMFREKIFADLQLKVHEKSIKVHKVVLAASSSVLAESLQSLGENQNVLELEDVEFEVAEEMVNFIYDGTVKDMEKQAESLLEVADKFKINRLKAYCEKYFYENLCTLNAIETLKLSAKCHAQELKNECIRFIRK